MLTSFKFNFYVIEVRQFKKNQKIKKKLKKLKQIYNKNLNTIF